MASVTASASEQRPEQNWIVGQNADAMFIIAAPIFALIWAIITFQTLGARALLAIFIVFNVGHHLPTFIRIYGDRELLKRFRWSLILGPVIPFCAFMALVGHVISKGQPVENVFFLSIILTLWDPWHFLMQHYGFMRIYDRHNAAPRKLAGRMDLTVCATWFVFIMIAAGGWFPDVLYKLKVTHGLPLYLLFAGGIYTFLKTAALIVALVATFAYLLYLNWCSRQGHFVSRAKIWLMLITFGIMYLTYTPNSLIQGILPGWTFALGFATLGMVHVTQYLAIVWKYNRGLASGQDRARSGLFTRLFSRGGAAIAAAYTIVCLLYGFSLSEMAGEWIIGAWSNVFAGGADWLLGCLLAACFTSTFLHYYYDGFIWKVRHQENRLNLGLQKGTAEVATETLSWWDRSNSASVVRALSKQLLYFIPPLSLVIVTWYLVQVEGTETAPLESAQNVILGLDEKTPDVNADEVSAAISTIDEQILFEEDMAEIVPRPKHFAYIAELSLTKARLKERLAKVNGVSEMPTGLLDDMQVAVGSFEQLLKYPGPYDHPERTTWSQNDILQLVSILRQQVNALELRENLPGSSGN
ncbi:MAG: hypothetical protein CMJ78_04660 [Planctomycetaceae bacterium]|nr:hypothetical protein [Planctomycetaceae bacterium]